jgi:hypothetical protein
VTGFKMTVHPLSLKYKPDLVTQRDPESFLV